MIRINLLPHREGRRKARQSQFVALAVAALVLGGVIVFLVHEAIDAKISYQMRRNEYLKQQTLILDKQITELKDLREQISDLLARKSVVDGLQMTRSNAVHLLDQMLRILPDGVYLKSIKQTGDKINMVGYAQSNARVSTLMRSIEDSPWLEQPVLVEIHGTGSGLARTNEFTLNFNLSGQTPVTPATAPGKKGAP